MERLCNNYIQYTMERLCKIHMCDMHMPKKIITIAMMKIYFAVDVSIYGMQ